MGTRRNLSGRVRKKDSETHAWIRRDRLILLHKIAYNARQGRFHEAQSLSRELTSLDVSLLSENITDEAKRAGVFEGT